jgi:hypothetical protein
LKNLIIIATIWFLFWRIFGYVSNKIVAWNKVKKIIAYIPDLKSRLERIDYLFNKEDLDIIHQHLLILKDTNIKNVDTNDSKFFIILKNIISRENLQSLILKAEICYLFYIKERESIKDKTIQVKIEKSYLTIQKFVVERTFRPYILEFIETESKEIITIVQDLKLECVTHSKFNLSHTSYLPNYLSHWWDLNKNKYATYF